MSSALTAAVQVFRLDVEPSGTQIVFSDKVLEHFARYQQLHRKDAEAGGQLFARLTRYEIYVELATGPREGDRRSRFGYAAQPGEEQKEIDRLFSLGLHFIGDWHTHPEMNPRPSVIDLATIGSCSLKSKHHLAAFMLVIVGQGPIPDCLHVSLHHGFRKKLIAG
jgi:integrative and conjugative element protein (TIGR02256 family)